MLVNSFILTIGIGEGIRSTRPGVKAGRYGNWGFAYSVSAWREPGSAQKEGDWEGQSRCWEGSRCHLEEETVLRSQSGKDPSEKPEDRWSGVMVGSVEEGWSAACWEVGRESCWLCSSEVRTEIQPPSIERLSCVWWEAPAVVCQACQSCYTVVWLQSCFQKVCGGLGLQLSE